MPCVTPFWKKHKVTLKWMPLPCGKCKVCKESRVNKWVFRLKQEELISSTSYFITLTYDQATVPRSKNNFKTLDKRDFQLFMKRLRKKNGKSKIKYYACGEYGEQFERPHYHAIIFNVKDPEYINQAWDLGIVDIGSVSGKSIAYTVRYIDKDSKIPKHARDDRLREFSLMSKGLGLNYIDKKIIKYHKADLSRNYVVDHQGHKISLPRIYRDRIYTELEKRAQVKIMTEHFNKRIEKIRHEYWKLYGKNNIFTFERYMDAMAEGNIKGMHNILKTKREFKYEKDK